MIVTPLHTRLNSIAWFMPQFGCVAIGVIREMTLVSRMLNFNSRSTKKEGGLKDDGRYFQVIITFV
jgi:hypothetical protein